MKFLRRCIPALCLMLAVYSAAAQDKKYGTPQIQIRNAYEAAKVWARLESAAKARLLSSTKVSLNPDTSAMLMGSLIWYANLQDEADEQFDSLLKKLERYPRLRLIAQQVFLSMYPASIIFRSELDTLASTGLDPSAKKYIDAIYSRYVGFKKKLKKIDSLLAVDTSRRGLMNDFQAAIETEDSFNIKRLSKRVEIEASLSSSDTGNLPLLEGFRNAAKTENLDSIIIFSEQLLAGAKPISAIDARIHAWGDSAEKIRQLMSNIEKEVNDTVNKNPDNFASLLAINHKQDVVAHAPLTVVNEAATRFAVSKQAFNVNYLTDVSGPQAAFHMPSQSEMIDAVAIYLAKRMKQEAVMWFFETISKNAKSYPLIATFFPNTIKILRSYEVYEIPNMGAQWQYALSKDFTTMPENVLTSQWMQQRCPGLAKYQSFITGGTAMAAMLQERYSYRDIISKLYLDSKAQADGETGFGFNKVTGLFYAAHTELFMPDSNQRYRMLKYEDYRGMSVAELEIMISLLDMKYNGIFSKMLAGMDKKLEFKSDSRVKAEDIRMLLGKVEQTINRIETMRREYIRQMQAQKDGGNKDWDYSTYNVWTSASQLWSIYDTKWASTNIFSDELNDSRQAFTYAGDLYEVYNLISKRNYAGAVNNTLKLVDSIFYSNRPAAGAEKEFVYPAKDAKRVQGLFGESELLKEVSTLIEQKFKGPRSIETTRLEYLINTYKFEVDTNGNMRFGRTSPMASIVFEKDRHAVQQIRKLAAFLNDAALAQNDKQLAKSIESYALPPGSYKRKRNNWYSLDLNAYAGVYGGMEGLFQDRKAPDDYAGVVGFSAPIGLTLSKTFSRKKCPDDRDDTYILNPNKVKLSRNNVRYRSKLNVAMTLSIVDLGAVVSYRLSNTTAQALPREVNWQQLLSPGLHFAVGIPSTPLVGMMGAQFTPLLREVTETQKQYNAFRIYGGLYFDLPLLNFWERKRIAY